MHVLITRPRRDGETLKARIEQLGCRATLSPLIDIVLEDIPASAIEGASALIATSRNGLRALAASPALRSAIPLPLYVVGPGTAAIAKDLGFKDIIEGAGTGADLIPVLSTAWRAKGGTLVHIAGDVLSVDLKSALASEGIDVRTITAYRSVIANALSPEAVQALKAGTVDATILMSPRTAEAWSQLAPGSLSPPELSGMTYLCLSDAVASALRQRLEAESVFVAAAPNLEEMLALVKRLAAHSGADC
jgi:uroporphyrinogen-III synthase